MNRALLLSFVTALILALVAPTARAGGRMEAEGFRISVPPGFHRLDSSEGGVDFSNQMKLSGGLNLKGQPDVHVFFAGLQSRPDAVLIAARMELADNSRMRSRLDLQRYVLDNLRVSKEEFDALVAAEGVKLTPCRRGEYDALEMSHDGSRGALGLLNEPATRTLTVLGGDFVLVLVLMVADDIGVPIEETWQQVSRSLVIESRGAIIQSVLLYGGAGLALLVLIVFILRVRAQRRARAPAWARGVDVRAAATRPADRQVPDLRPAGGRPEHGTTRRGPDGIGTSLPLPERPAAPARVELTPTQPGDSHPLPHPDVERPAAAPADAAPPRKGLIRTRPEQGRYSD